MHNTIPTVQPFFYSLKVKIRFAWFLSLMLLALACNQKLSPVEANHFTLQGKTNEMPDGTILYLTETLSNQVVDSIKVTGNTFQTEGDLVVSPTNFYLHTEDFSEYVSIWVEPGTMTFDASATDFKHAVITGSETQTEARDFLEAIASIDEEDMEETERLAMEFIKAHPTNRLSASMLAGYAPNWGKAKVEELYNPFSQANKESEYGKQIWQYITLHKDHQIGDRFTDFDLNTPEGRIIKLSDHLGKVTLLEFWASWCGPCRKQNPELVKTYKKYHQQGFDIIGISLDFSKKDWEDAIAKDSLVWTHGSDLKGRNSLGAIIYGINAIPDNYLIDSNGIIIGKYLWGEDLEMAIQRGLN